MVDFTQPFWDEPIVFAYRFTLRPGRIKGWGMHKHQADRYLLIAGNMRTVLFDGREASTTQGATPNFTSPRRRPRCC